MEQVKHVGLLKAILPGINARCIAIQLIVRCVSKFITKVGTFKMRYLATQCFLSP